MKLTLKARKISRDKTETKEFEKQYTQTKLNALQDELTADGFRHNKNKTGFWAIDNDNKFVFITLKEQK